MQMDAPTQLRRVCELRLERWATLSGVMMASGAPVSTKICEKPDVAPGEPCRRQLQQYE